MSAVAAARSVVRARSSSWRRAPSLMPSSRRDVGVRAIGHRDRDERGALAIGQGLDAVQRRAQLLAPLDLGLEAGRRQLRGHRRQGRAGRAQRVERLVVGDAVQPRAQLAHLGAGAQRLPCAHEARLQDVLGQRLAQQPAQIALQRAAVALDDRLEGPIVAIGRERDETAVALGAQQGGGQQRRHDRETTVAPLRHAASRSNPWSLTRRTSGRLSRLRSNSSGV